MECNSDRHVEPTTIHPWTGQAVGFNYLVDQNPMDHDNDGITDEDVDGSGRGSYDEDDDNDGRIDQFVWPCDFDSDGIQDYFDDDDDNDGVRHLRHTPMGPPAEFVYRNRTWNTMGLLGQVGS